MSTPAEMLGNRLRKRLRALKPWAARNAVSCYRLYDHDIPEVPLTIDFYNGSLVMSDRRRFDDELADETFLPSMTKAVSEATGVVAKQIFVRRRQRLVDRQEGHQYERVAELGEWREVTEGGLTFWVNLSDYLDTGLFLDHRPTRAKFRSEAAGKRVLNLFCYTGTFTVYAADGGAVSSTSVDMSRTYLDWAAKNWDANGLDHERHRRVQADTREFLAAARARRDRWDLVIVDPPTFSNSKRMNYTWDIQRDHAALLADVAEVVSPGGVLWFSTNRDRFTFDGSTLPSGSTTEDLTSATIPEDIRDPKAHRAYRIVMPQA